MPPQVLIVIIVALVLVGLTVIYYFEPQIIKKLLRVIGIIFGVLFVIAGILGVGQKLTRTTGSTHLGAAALIVGIGVVVTLLGLLLLRLGPKLIRNIVLGIAVATTALTSIPINSFSYGQKMHPLPETTAINEPVALSMLGPCDGIDLFPRDDYMRHSLLLGGGLEEMRKIKVDVALNGSCGPMTHRLYVL